MKVISGLKELEIQVHNSFINLVETFGAIHVQLEEYSRYFCQKP